MEITIITIIITIHIIENEEPNSNIVKNMMDGVI